MIKFDTLKNRARAGIDACGMVTLDTIKRGSKNGLTVILNLGKIIIPIYIIMTFLQHTPFIGYVANLFEPVMKLMGLPGDAAIALVAGNFINIAAAIGVIATITLTGKQITILAVMLSFSHALLIETAICKKIGVKASLIIGIRVALALVSGLLLNIIL